MANISTLKHPYKLPLTKAIKAICFLSLLLLPIFVFPQLTGKVVSISDGDTFTLLTGEKEQIKISIIWH